MSHRPSNISQRKLGTLYNYTPTPKRIYGVQKQ